MFVDQVQIHIKAGDGGHGAVAFHREKYIASGGPDGGDGGKGGDVVFLVDDNLSTLADFKYKRKYKAQNGADGSGARRVRVNRVRCRSCGKTHALIWHDMVPYKLRSEGFHLRAFRSWASGRSMRSLLESTAIPPSSLRRMIWPNGSAASSSAAACAR